ncbi:hypothetical protein TNCV_822821, partial [Trichonephila clavipes]
AWRWVERTAAVRREILDSSTLGFRLPVKSDRRKELFKLLQKSDLVTALELSL